MENLKNEDIETISCRYGTMSILKNDIYVSQSLKVYGEWAQMEIDFLLDLTTSGDTVLDIGAFIGTHTLPFARLVGQHGSVYAFEPNPIFFELLRRNVEQNPTNNVVLANVALSYYVGKIDMTDAVDISKTGNFAGNSILSNKVNLRQTTKRNSINVTTIDRQDIRKCALIKIDVEGMEADVLKGGLNTLRTCRPIVFAECNSLQHGWKTAALMEEEEYCTYLLNVPSYNPHNFRQNQEKLFGDAREAGLICIPSERLTEFQHRLRHYDCLIPISCLDDLALGLLKKPQYKHEVMANTNAARVLGIGFWYNETELKQLQSEVAEIKMEVPRLREEVACRECLISDLNSKVSAIRHTIEEKNNIIGAHESENSRLLVELEILRQRNQQKEKLLADHDAERNRLQSELSALEQSNRRKRRLLAKRNTERDRLEWELAALRHSNRLKDKQLGDREAAYGHLEAEWRVLHRYYQKNGALIGPAVQPTQLSEELATLRQSNQEKDKIIAELNAEYHHLEIELEALRQSNQEKDIIAEDKDRYITELSFHLNSMQQTIGWRTLERLRNLFPEGSKRRKLYQNFRKAARVFR